jgi:hypothetical protein
MTYDAKEISTYSGRPIEFYLFSTESRDYAYTSAPIDLQVTIGGTPYDFKSIYITSPEIEHDANIQEGDIQFAMSRTAAVAKLNIKHQHPSKIAVIIYRRHQGDSEVRPYWNGNVKSVELKGDVAEVVAENLLAASKRNGLQYNYTPPCNFTPYIFPCPVDRNNFRYPATVVSIDTAANTITVSGIDSYAIDWFKGGEVELADNDGRDILSDTISSPNRILELSASFPATSLRVGDALYAIAGDDLTFATCSVKMDTFGETNQGEAFGGFPYSVKSNPMKPTEGIVQART